MAARQLSSMAAELSTAMMRQPLAAMFCRIASVEAPREQPIS
jgi:hypothetical protein